MKAWMSALCASGSGSIVVYEICRRFGRVRRRADDVRGVVKEAVVQRRGLGVGETRLRSTRRTGNLAWPNQDARRKDPLWDPDGGWTVICIAAG